MIAIKTDLIKLFNTLNSEIAILSPLVKSITTDGTSVQKQRETVTRFNYVVASRKLVIMMLDDYPSFN